MGKIVKVSGKEFPVSLIRQQLSMRINSQEPVEDGIIYPLPLHYIQMLFSESMNPMKIGPFI
jgi:hypothetical protein